MSIEPKYYKELGWQERRDLRNAYIEYQEGLCLHCLEGLKGLPAERVRKKKLNMRLFPKEFLKYPVHLHHCHKTGLTLGAVHAYCNGVLWQYHGQ